jgi:hypothetical protein
MSFDVSADAYTRFTGRYSELLGEGSFDVSATAWAVTSRA